MPVPLGVVRTERDLSGIIDVVSQQDYSVREFFTRIFQILEIASIDEEEWDDVEQAPSECDKGLCIGR